MPASRPQIVVIQMPDHRRPRIVQHPLNHTRGGIFITAVALEHRANALIRHHLRLLSIVIRTARGPIARIQSASVDIQIFEYTTPGMELPGVVHRPQMIFTKHGFQALYRRHRGPGVGLRIESMSTAAASKVTRMSRFIGLWTH